MIHEETDKPQEYRHLRKGPDKEVWERSFANEFGRVMQGVGGRIKGTNTFFLWKKKRYLLTKRRPHMEELYVISDHTNKKHIGLG